MMDVSFADFAAFLAVIYIFLDFVGFRLKISIVTKKGVELRGEVIDEGVELRGGDYVIDEGVKIRGGDNVIDDSKQIGGDYRSVIVNGHFVYNNYLPSCPRGDDSGPLEDPWEDIPLHYEIPTNVFYDNSPDRVLSKKESVSI